MLKRSNQAEVKDRKHDEAEHGGDTAGNWRKTNNEMFPKTKGNMKGN